LSIRNKRVRQALRIYFLLLLTIACQRGPSDDAVVARVGNAVLTKDLLKRKLEWEGMREDQEFAFVERWINRELLYQEAKRMGLDQTEELQWEMELVEKEFLTQRLLDRTFAQKIQITDEEVASHYEKYREEFQVEEDEVRALHILTETQEEANAARQEVLAGRDFGKVAEERSSGIFRDMGGDMGYVQRGDVIPEVERILFRLQEGGVSQVFRSNYGYHLIKVIKKRSRGSIKDLDDIRNEIIQRIRVNKERAVYYDLLYQLQNKTKIDVAVPRDSVLTHANPLSDDPNGS